MRFTGLILIALSTASVGSAYAEPAQFRSDTTPGTQSIEIDRLASSAALIQSRSDLETYLSGNPDSAIHRLSHGGRATFLASLVLTEKGLGSFNARSLEDELTPTQIYEVLSLFGLGELVSQFKNARIETSHDERLLSIGAATKDDAATQCLTCGPCPAIYNYRCSPPATCKPQYQNYCVTCNCGMQTP
jgi:hypothetical protein